MEDDKKKKKMKDYTKERWPKRERHKDNEHNKTVRQLFKVLCYYAGFFSFIRL